MAGEGRHAREHLLQRLQGLACFIQALVIEQQAQGCQLHALGGQRLVDLVGQRRRHLPKRRQLGRLHQALLGGAQVAGAGFDQAFEFFAAALAQAGQAQALADEQQGEHQAQPDRSGSQRGVAAIFADLRLAQQVQGPALGFQRQAFPQVVGIALGALHAHQVAVGVKAAEDMVL
ncbi:hypothetical protein D9M71_330530 [compost metagenome]